MEFPKDEWLLLSLVPMNKQDKIFCLLFTGRFTTQAILESKLSGKTLYWKMSLFQYEFIFFNICGKKHRALQAGTQWCFMHDINISLFLWIYFSWGIRTTFRFFYIFAALVACWQTYIFLFFLAEKFTVENRNCH